MWALGKFEKIMSSLFLERPFNCFLRFLSIISQLFLNESQLYRCHFSRFSRREKILEIACYSGIDVLLLLWASLLNIMWICQGGAEIRNPLFEERFLPSPLIIREHFLVPGKERSGIYLVI